MEGDDRSRLDEMAAERERERKLELPPYRRRRLHEPRPPRITAAAFLCSDEESRGDGRARRRSVYT